MAFEAQYVILIKGSDETSEWLSLILKDHGLVVEQTSISGSQTRKLLLVQIPDTMVPTAAQEMMFYKMNRERRFKVFTRKSWREFTETRSKKIIDLFSFEEKQEILGEYLYSIRCGDNRTSIPGYPNHFIEPGQSILGYCQNYNIFQTCFPPHDYEALFKLRKQFLTEVSLPIYEIREYFGLGIAFYFAFLSFFTWSLAPPMIVSLVTYYRLQSSFRSIVLNTIFLILWNAISMELWKMQEFNLSCFWGLHSGVRRQTRLLYDRARAVETTNKFAKIARLIYSYLIIAFCVFFAIAYTVLNAYCDDLAVIYFPGKSILHQIMCLVPTIVFSIFYFIFFDIYNKLSIRLTNGENHSKESTFAKHLTVKLVLFDFFTRFGYLYYTAFYARNIPLLRSMVYIQLIMYYTRDNALEVCIPKIMRHVTAVIATVLKKQTSIHFISMEGLVGQAHADKYGGLYLDFYKIFCQTTYVFLFCSVAPLTPFIAFFGNIINMYVDFFKLVLVYQRPRKEVTLGIGIWSLAIRFLSYLAIPSNVALITISNYEKIKTKYNFKSDVQILMTALFLEHGFFFAVRLTQMAIKKESECTHGLKIR